MVQITLMSVTNNPGGRVTACFSNGTCLEFESEQDFRNCGRDIDSPEQAGIDNAMKFLIQRGRATGNGDPRGMVGKTCTIDLNDPSPVKYTG
jgi:hypothetical protein